MTSKIAARVAAVLAIVLVAGAVVAQRPEDPGPYAVGWRTITFANPYAGSSSIPCLVCYPATAAQQGAPLDLSGAPYPAIVFGHGFTADGQSFLQLGRHLASWGFFFVAHDTLRFGPQTSQRTELEAVVRLVRDEHVRTGSFFFNAVDVNRIAVAGHSMGGGSAAGVLGGNVGVQAGVLLAPLAGLLPDTSDWMQTATAPFQVIVGNGDIVTPPSSNAVRFYQKGGQVSNYRGLTHLWGGADHFSVKGTGSNPTPDEIDAFRLSRRQMTAFLLAVLHGQDAFLDVLVGNGAHAEPRFDTLAYDVRDPNLYLQPGARVGATLDFVPMGAATRAVLTVASPAPAQIPLGPLGMLGVNPTLMFPIGTAVVGARQTAPASFPIPNAAVLAGAPIWVQCITEGSNPGQRLSPTRRFTIGA